MEPDANTVKLARSEKKATSSGALVADVFGILAVIIHKIQQAIT